MKCKIKKEGIKKILVSRTDNIGDVILTLPLISEIKKHFPQAKIVFLVKSNLKSLLNDYEDIDDFIFIDEIKSNIDLYKKICAENFDLVFCVYPRFNLSLLFFLCGIKYRVGTAYRGYSFLYNLKVKEHRKYAEKHESQYNLNLLNSLMGENSQSIEFKFKISENEKLDLINKLSQELDFKSNYKFIIIHPGSRQSAIDLPLNTLKEFIRVFLNEFKNYKIFITGSKDDKLQIDNLLEDFKDEIGKNIINVSNLLNLRELMVLIDLSYLFISNSTGPIHIAGALNKKIIGFYPNVPPMHPVRWKPLSKNAKILTPTINLSDMSEIKAEDIIRLTYELLEL